MKLNQKRKEIQKMKNRMIKSVTVLLVVSICVIVYAATEVRWDEADKYYGQTVTVTGKIVATHNSGKACFLNFHQNYTKYFSAVIFASDFSKFPPNPENYYLNKDVKVTGLVREYQGKPEIILKEPSQIAIVGEENKPKPLTGKAEDKDLLAKITTLQDQVADLTKRVVTLEEKVKEHEIRLGPVPLTH
jgi:DNA/RNA endonuclease YhcR with UshA esterase domain